MAKKSAGILLYRSTNNVLEVLLVHPGGPFWIKKDIGAWSIPKGEFTENENPLDAAKRELKEETGKEISEEFFPLTPVIQKSGKLIYAWAVENDFNPEEIVSNTFEMEWPPKSGIKKSFPEIDKAVWFSVTEAKEKIIPGQAGFIDELLKKINQ